jgi:L-ascorbate metabolism protein UlaG (beta-lactamase superfamily)
MRRERATSLRNVPDPAGVVDRAGLRRRSTAIAIAVAIVAIAALGAWVGWWSPARPWTAAIGLDAIPVSERPTAVPAWSAAEVGVEPPDLSWLGHSGFVLRWRGTTLLLDPNLDLWCTIARRRLRPAPDPRAIGPVDVVLVSHAHYDHLDLPTIASLEGSPRIVVPAGAERWLDEEAAAVPVEAGDRLRIGALEVVAVPAAHNGNRLHPFASRVRALGYVVRARGVAIYFAGDTGFANDFEEIGRRFHPRLAILPIGAWSPRAVMRRYHLSPEEAVAVSSRLGASVVVPCHFGTFTLALDRPDRALPRFAAAARARGVRWMLPPLIGAAGAPAMGPGAGALLTEAAP